VVSSPTGPPLSLYGDQQIRNVSEADALTIHRQRHTVRPHEVYPGCYAYYYRRVQRSGDGRVGAALPYFGIERRPSRSPRAGWRLALQSRDLRAPKRLALSPARVRSVDPEPAHVARTGLAKRVLGQSRRPPNLQLLIDASRGKGARCPGAFARMSDECANASTTVASFDFALTTDSVAIPQPSAHDNGPGQK
jgi:hypothetical protein